MAGLPIPVRGGRERKGARICHKERGSERLHGNIAGAERVRPILKCKYLRDFAWEVAR